MIDVHPISDDGEWNKYVDRAAAGSVFHRSEFLRAIATETGTELDLLVGKNGEHPIGIFPVFTGSKGPFRTAFSPPPHAGVPYLGPATMLDPNIKRRKASLRTKEFLEACLEWIDREHEPHYVRVVTDPNFEEVRPFRWSGFDLTPWFTYELDLDREESDLLRSFSRDARSSIQDNYDPEFAIADGGEQLAVDDGMEAAYAIEEGGGEAVEYLASRLERRFAEQDEEFHVSADFLKTVYEELPGGTIAATQFLSEGTPVSGRLSLFFDGRVTFWHGVPKPNEDVDLPINDLLNWHSIRRARERGCDVADLSGANVERLWDHKAKFNPELTNYYIVERASPTAVPALKLYKRWQS